jgi:pimeloyl-ACP methyl ester carboxylesterase
MTIHFKTPQFDAQLMRALSHASYGGAEVNECLMTASQIEDGNVDSWAQQWFALAERLEKAADQSCAEGHAISARDAYLRSAVYYHTATLMLMRAPVDPRLIEALQRQTRAFQKAAKLMATEVEAIRIPYENTTLPGYFFKVDNQSRPTLILVGGYDSTSEEMYFFNVLAALRRGYHCLTFDGPGQGRALVEQQLYFRPDWEAVITPVVDYALARPEVEAKHLGMIGLSWGGYLSLRAATAEPRLAACVADPGQYDLLELMKSRVPGSNALKDRLLDVDSATIRPILSLLMRSPFMAWTFERNMFVHGVATPLDYVRISPDYTLKGRIGQIHCPTLICDAADDAVSVAAKAVYDRLTCPKAYIRFTTAEGAGEHCESGARMLFHQRAFDWLDTALMPSAN